MEITLIYIISQVITVAYYAILSLSYLLKDRNKILTANFVAHIGQASAMAMLNGYTGAAMSVIMMLRDLTLLIQERQKEKEIIIYVRIILLLVITSLGINQKKERSGIQKKPRKLKRRLGKKETRKQRRKNKQF